jgi:hypothetical protein
LFRAYEVVWLQALDSSMSDEQKVAHLAKMLLNEDPAAFIDARQQQVEVGAAMQLAQDHIRGVVESETPRAHAPMVLLAALAMSAVDELKGLGKQ